MRLSKRQAPRMLEALDILLANLETDIEELEDGEEKKLAEEKRELVAQLHDKVSQLLHGDGTAMLVEIFYGN